MRKYKFEIHNCITVEVEGQDAEDARMRLIEDPDLYADELANDCVINNGKEIINSPYEDIAIAVFEVKDITSLTSLTEK